MTRLLKWIAPLWLALAGLAMAAPSTTQVPSSLSTTQCASGAAVLGGGAGNPISCGASATPSGFGGTTTAGSANAQTLASTNPGGFVLTAGNTVCAKAGFTNTGAATLSVNATTATAVNRRSTAGLTALVGGEIQTGVGYCWFYDGTVYELFEAPIAGSVEIKNASYLATTLDNNDTYVFTAISTLTLPVSTSLPNNWRITVFAEGGNVTVTPNAADRINGGSVGASVTVLFGASSIITTDGAGNIYVPVLSAGSGTVGAGTTDQVAYYTGAGTVVGGTFMPVPTPQGRLTISSGNPVMTATITGASSVYYTPYFGGVEPLWDGTAFMPVLCAEVSNVLANSAVGNAGPAAGANATVYDLFLWNNAGACTLTRGPAWTNTTTRSAGTALARVNGVLTNSVGITNGPGANAGTYVGTVFTDAGAATVTWNRGGAASGGTAGVLDVWNYYNRVSTGATITDNGVSYTYSSATTRQARASAGNQVTFVIGVQEDSVIGNYNAAGTTAAASGAVMEWGIGLNSTTANGSGTGIIKSVNATGIEMGQAENVSWFAPIGVNIMSANEGSDGTNANSFDSLANNVLSMAGRF